MGSDCLVEYFNKILPQKIWKQETLKSPSSYKLSKHNLRQWIIGLEVGFCWYQVYFRGVNDKVDNLFLFIFLVRKDNHNKVETNLKLWQRVLP